MLCLASGNNKRSEDDSTPCIVNSWQISRPYGVVVGQRNVCSQFAHQQGTQRACAALQGWTDTALYAIYVAVGFPERLQNSQLIGWTPSSVLILLLKVHECAEPGVWLLYTTCPAAQESVYLEFIAGVSIQNQSISVTETTGNISQH
jgi:hypothetical protein